MALIKTLHHVLQNLRDGRDATAVRTDRVDPPSKAYRDRMAAVQQTEDFIASLSDRLPGPLLQVLQDGIAHVQQPLLDAGALAAHVASQRQALSFALNRAGTEPSQADAQRLERLDALQPLLERLA